MKKGLTFLLIILLLLVFQGSAAAENRTCDFTDTKGHWGEQEIKMACQNGLLAGTGQNEQGESMFSPDTQVTRAQLGVWLAKTFALDYGQLRFIKAPVAGDYFWDVENDAWYADAVMLCAINDIFTAGRELHPDECVTRIEVARSITRAFKAKEINVPMIMLMPHFADMEGLPQEDFNAIVFVNNTGIMTGDKDMFRPHDYLTRAELARIANRCYELVKMNSPMGEPTDFSLQIGVEEIQTSTDYLETDAQIPVISGMKNEAAQQQINQQFQQVVADYQTDLTAQAVEYKQNAEEMGFPYHQFQLYTRCGPYFENGKILSLYVDYYAYSGGAHGMTDRRAYNYDAATGKVLQLKDLFVPGYAYKPLIDAAISGEINRRPMDFFEGEMGFQGISDQQNFYLQNGSLIIYFNQYEIAPYAAGIQEFRIPLQDFNKGLVPELELTD